MPEKVEIFNDDFYNRLGSQFFRGVQKRYPGYASCNFLENIAFKNILTKAECENYSVKVCENYPDECLLNQK